MFRAGIAVAALAAFIAVTPRASAQPIMPLTNSPGYVPFPAAPTIQQPGPGAPRIVYFPIALPSGWGLGWGYETYNPWTGFGYAFGGIVPPEGFPAPQPVIAAQPRRPEPVVLPGDYPATLALQLPAAAEVWLDGKKVTGDPAKERVLTSPALKPEQKYAFLVKARWTSDGKTYEANRAVTLSSGDRSRLMIVSGDEVKE